MPLANDLEWVPFTRLIADAIVLAGKLPANVIGVAGVPRCKFRL